jgi:choline-sulfatase
MARPNILILFSDQLRPFELGCHGHRVVRTPNIDRLARTGVRFEHAITTNPVCSPARASLISGQFGRTCTGMLGCCGEPVWRRAWFPDATLPERLQTAGYETALTGKWHIEPQPRLVGFEQAVYPKVAHLNRGQTFFDAEGRARHVPGFAPDFEVDTSCALVRRERSRPWFLFHNLSLPHMPYFDVPERYLTMYDPEELELRPNAWRDGELYHDERAFKIYLFDHLCTKLGLAEHFRLPDGFDLRRLYAQYCGLVTAVDDQVGAIMDSLEETGQIENTIIVFTSDHGDNMGSHHLWNKISPNDEALRVPFLMAWPGRIGPRVVDTHVASLADVAPTLLSLAGLPVPGSMQGRDLGTVLRGETGRIGQGEAYAENLYGELIVRTPTHKLVAMSRTSDPGPAREITQPEYQFFDLRTDPCEQLNLVATGEQQELADALRERLLDWDRRTPWMAGSRGGVYGQGPEHDSR